MTNGERKAKSEVKKRKFGTASKFTALLVFCGLVGWASDPLLGLFGITFGEANLSLWILIPALVLSLLFVLAFHEAGHVVGGKLVGFRFVLFIVGPFKLHSTESGVRLGLNRSLTMAGGLGAVGKAGSVLVGGGRAARGNAFLREVGDGLLALAQDDEDREFPSVPSKVSSTRRVSPVIRNGSLCWTSRPRILVTGAQSFCWVSVVVPRLMGKSPVAPHVRRSEIAHSPSRINATSLRAKPSRNTGPAPLPVIL